MSEELRHHHLPVRPKIKLGYLELGFWDAEYMGSNIDTGDNYFEVAIERWAEVALRLTNREPLELDYLTTNKAVPYKKWQENGKIHGTTGTRIRLITYG